MNLAGNQKTVTSVAGQVLAGALEWLTRREDRSPSFELPPNLPRRPAINHLLNSMFRRLGWIDWALARLCRKGRASRELQSLLRLSLAQMLSEDGLPPAIVVDVSVRLAHSRFSRREAGFVNAVLRSFLREQERLAALPETELPATARFNLGRELLIQWRRHLDESEVCRLAELLQTPPKMMVRRRLPCPTEEPDNELAETLRPAPTFDWAAGERFWQCLQPRMFLASAQFKQGYFYVQDPATALAPAMLQPAPGETIADLCAAPGGKSLLLSDKLAGQGRLLCGDIDHRRLHRLCANLKGSERIWLFQASADQPPLAPGSCNAVLLDVPCSNTGVIRRRPDVRWRFSHAALQRLLRLQSAMLAGSAPLLAPGGRLVYSTCSLEPEENSGQVRDFLRRHPRFALVRERLLMPATWHDGAYAALLRCG